MVQKIGLFTARAHQFAENEVLAPPNFARTQKERVCPMTKDNGEAGEILSPALAALLQIMTSTEVAEAKCVEAAKAIIEYEAPQGVYDLTHRYLIGVAEDEEQSTDLRLEALKLLRKVEARRVAPPPAASLVANKETAERLGRAKQRLALVAEGKWPTSEAGWAENADNPALEMSTVGLAERLKAARR
ncbi:hypothetical protein C3731_17105 [Brucella oryzae]|uniref:Uncharacterized protein n=2 Tax=Brucella/Ochrobactrum group TaxID=2826938 RepID=A0A2S7IWC3_9HYPH|nr:hypothetical protein C3731_17105 [Brucella oryzae]